MPQVFHAKAEGVKPGQQHVFIAMPVMGGFPAALMDFMWQTQGHLKEHGIAADLFILADHCHVDDSRNICVWNCLEHTDCSDFLFVDSDTCTSHDAMVQLLKHPHDVVAGLYPYKGDRENYPVRLPKDMALCRDEHGCIQVEAVPTGFLRIKRGVLEKLEAVSAGFWNKEVTPEAHNRPIPLIFERTVEDTGKRLNGRVIGDRWSGDFVFCNKWKALGGTVHADPRLWFRHYGSKAFSGNFDVHWFKATGEPTQKFDQCVEALHSEMPLAPEFMGLHTDWGNEYAAEPDLLQAAYWMAREADGPILETGSGLTTIVLGIAAKLAGQRVYALEHDPDHYRRTVDVLKRYGLGNVRLFYAPLRRHEYASGRSCLWYTIPEGLPESFALVLCDGPQQRFGRDGLYKLLGPRIEGAKIIMDDAGTDAGAVAALRKWSDDHGSKFSIMDGDKRTFVVSIPASQQTQLSSLKGECNVAVLRSYLRR